MISRAAGWLAVGVMAAAWAGLSALLAARGHLPSGPSPFGREHHYAVQAVILVPLFLLGLRLYAGIAQALLRRAGGMADGATTTRILGLGTGLPLLLLFVLPDLVAFLIGGFEAMAALLPLTGPLALLACLGAGTIGAARAHALLVRRAILPVGAGFLAMSALLSIALR